MMPTKVCCVTLDKLLDDSTNFVDKHIRLIQNTLYLFFGAGLFVIGRRLHLIKRFHSATDIPSIYFTKQVSLRGKIIKISNRGIISLQHIPIVPTSAKQKLIPFRSKDSENDFLKVSLVGLDFVESHQEKALEELNKLKDTTVWFKLVYHNPPDKSMKDDERNVLIYCLVYEPGWIFSTCINYKLLRLGLGQVQQLPGNLVNAKLTNNLFKAQKRAVYRKHGMWQTPPKEKGKSWFR